jgi:hypothetical protein
MPTPLKNKAEARVWTSASAVPSRAINTGCVLLYLKASNDLENWKLLCVMPLHVGEAKP